MKKAFTLLELLTVIVVMGILALIVTPLTANIIKSARKSSYKTSVDNLLITIKEEQTSEGLNQQVIYYIENGIISGDLKYDGKLNGNGFVRVDEDGKTVTKVEIDNFCIYKFRDDKKSTIVDGTCGEYGGFLLEALRVDRHSADLFSSYDERMGRFYIKMELEENENNNEYTQNADRNDRYYYFTGLTPGEDYYFYGKVLNIYDEELTASLKVDTPNVTMPTITVENAEIWKERKNVRIKYFEIEPDCTYEYRISYINETTGVYPEVVWQPTRNEEVNFSIAKNNTKIEVRVINKEGHVIRETSQIITKVDPTVPVMTKKGCACYIKTGTDRDILSRYFTSLAPYEETQGDYTREGHFGPSGGTNVCRINGEVVTNINELDRHDGYVLECTSETGAGVRLTTTISLTVANYQSEYRTRSQQCERCTYNTTCASRASCPNLAACGCNLYYSCSSCGCAAGHYEVDYQNCGCTVFSAPECGGKATPNQLNIVGNDCPGGFLKCCGSKYVCTARYRCSECGCETAASCPNDSCSCISWNRETANNCSQCGETPWGSWTQASTQSTNTITCQKQICRLDENGNTVSCKQCSNCGNISSDTCAGIPEDTCD